MSEKIPSPSDLRLASDEGKEKPKRKVPFLIGGEEKIFDRDLVMEDLRVKDIVRFQKEDFPNIDATPGAIFLHFNIEKSVNVPGEKYLLALIHRGGVPGQEPTLSFEGALIAECVEAKSNLRYEELTEEQLAQSLPGLRDVSSLQDTMVDRYSKSRGLSREQVIALGLGYTLFRIVGQAPASEVAR